MDLPHVLFLSYTWPSLSESAAGLRTLGLLDAMAEQNWKVIIASISKPNQALQDCKKRYINAHFSFHSVKANDAFFDEWIKAQSFSHVIFDRFVLFEQFGWRVRKHLPAAFCILDTQDIHFIRRIRENRLLKNQDINPCTFFSQDRYSFEEQNWIIREVTAILQSDLVLLVSDFEKNILEENFFIDPAKLAVIRFGYLVIEPLLCFEKRKDFIFMGNFRHAPNIDSIECLEKLWPSIQEALPTACVRIFGSYIPRQIAALHNPAKKFFIMGRAKDHLKVFQTARVNLAYLRFGAGIKGKVSDGWAVGTPCVATSIAAEGMTEQYPFAGLIANTADAFIQAAVRLYQDKELWQQSQNHARFLMHQLYSKDHNAKQFIQLVLQPKPKPPQPFSAWHLLEYYYLKSGQYLSKWIEIKKPKN